jgi:hypothetical protein
MNSRTEFLRQYFKFIRSGAVRIQATSDNGSFQPLAFINKNGSYVVVVDANQGGDMSIKGLEPGTYGIKYTTGTQYDVNLSDVTVGAGQSLSASIPAAGVITIYAKSPSTSPTPPPADWNRIYLPSVVRSSTSSANQTQIGNVFPVANGCNTLYDQSQSTP